MTRDDIEKDELTQYLRDTLSEDLISPEKEERMRRVLRSFQQKHEIKSQVQRPRYGFLVLRPWSIALCLIIVMLLFSPQRGVDALAQSAKSLTAVPVTTAGAQVSWGDRAVNQWKDWNASNPMTPMLIFGILLYVSVLVLAVWSWRKYRESETLRTVIGIPAGLLISCPIMYLVFIIGYATPVYVRAPIGVIVAGIAFGQMLAHAAHAFMQQSERREVGSYLAHTFSSVLYASWGFGVYAFVTEPLLHGLQPIFHVYGFVVAWGLAPFFLRGHIRSTN